MDREKQFETMAAIRAYALEITKQMSDDQSPSTARGAYAKFIARMSELAKSLDVQP